MTQLTAAKKILIYGYGIEGKSTAAFLKSKDVNYFEIHDDNIKEYSSKKELDEYDVIIVSAGINREKVFPENLWSKCTSNTELFFHNLSPINRRKTIGITGTKGKSTTAKFIYELLQNCEKKVEVAGNYGKGLLDVLDQMDDLEFLVIELSSYQLAYLNRSVHLALCTNLFEDHVDWHGGIDPYHKAKANMWAHQTPSDFLFIPYRYCSNPFFETPGEKITSGSLYHQFFPDETCIWHAPHYLQNLGLAHQLYRHLDLGEIAFKKTCMEFEPLPHRMSFVRELNGVTFYDNAIGCNPHATIADIGFFKEKLGCLILGGVDRGNNFASVFEAIHKHHSPAYIIIQRSDASDKIKSILKENYPRIQFTVASTLEEAVNVGYEKTLKNKVCLLSPACASFDRYKNYEDKGDAFVKYVNSL